jgi:hypothetical protein
LSSTYQNLIDETDIPSVSYPDSPAVGAPSKRSLHKVAEWGRRNRINDALKEMQGLIPTSDIRTEELVEKSLGTNKKDNMKSNSSKAATVESANRHIKMLKEGQVSQREVMVVLRKQYEEMRRRLWDDVATTGELNEVALEAAMKGSTKQSPAVVVEAEAK